MQESKPKTILVAEPNGALRQLLEFYLIQQGYNVSTANTTKQAWKAIESDKPDLLLLNVALPKDTGLKLVAQIRNSPGIAELPTIVFTEVSDKRIVVAMAKLGVDHYLLTKKVTLDDLLSAVTESLALRSAAADPDEAGEADHEDAAPASGGDAGTGESDPEDADPGMDLSSVHTLKDVKPLIKRSVIQEKLDQCGDLKGLSPAIAEVLKLTKTENCSISAVAKAVKKDQGVSLKLLKLANSSVYERGDPVDTITQAIMRMGLKSVRQAVLNLSVVDQFCKAHDPRLDTSLFWEHSIATGLIASSATRMIGGDEDEIDSAFTTGLLHDSGRMVYNEMFPGDYGRVLDVADHLCLPLNKVESRLLLVNHAECMDRVLRAWRFPKHLIDPIALHHLSAGNIRRMAPKSVKECCVLALANALAHALLLGHSGNTCLYPIKDYLAALDLGPEFVQQIVAEIPEQTLDIKLAMLANSGGVSMDYLKHLKDRLNQPIHPLVISVDTDIDPIQLMLDRMLDPPQEDSAPNLAIMNLPSKKQTASLTRKLRQAEEVAEVPGLPLIVVSPSGELRVDDAASGPAPRQQESLAMPLHVGRFIEVANSILGKPGVPLSPQKAA